MLLLFRDSTVTKLGLFSIEKIKIYCKTSIYYVNINSIIKVVINNNLKAAIGILKYNNCCYWL